MNPEAVRLLAEALEAVALVGTRAAALARQLERDEPQEGLVTVNVAAERLGVSDSMVRKLVRKGLLPGTRIGTSVRVSEAALVAYVRRRSIRSAA